MNKEERQKQLKSETHVGPKGELRWNLSNHVVPMDIFTEAGIEPPISQKVEMDREITKTIRQYAAARARRTPERLYIINNGTGDAAPHNRRVNRAHSRIGDYKMSNKKLTPTVNLNKYYDATVEGHRRIQELTLDSNSAAAELEFDDWVGDELEVADLPNDFSTWKIYEQYATLDGVLVRVLSRDGD